MNKKALKAVFQLYIMYAIFYTKKDKGIVSDSVLEELKSSWQYINEILNKKNFKGDKKLCIGYELGKICYLEFDEDAFKESALMATTNLALDFINNTTDVINSELKIHHKHFESILWDEIPWFKPITK